MYQLNIDKPTLLMNKNRVLRNIRLMNEKARKNNVRFRPHFKSHQSAQVGEWFRDCGVNAITVSSLDMAEYFMKYGWDDITVAFPVNILEINKINRIAKKIQLGLLVESGETIDALRNNITSNVNIWLKIDVGYHRTGISSNNPDLVIKLVKEVEKAEKLQFMGLLTHAGHSYNARSAREIEKVYHESVSHLTKLKNILREKFNTNIQISFGDTPTCSVVDDFSQVDEIRPGNFVFYDLIQRLIGSCREEDIAVTLACPVVAKHPERKELVIYGGAIHLSVAGMEINGKWVFGYITSESSTGWGALREDCYVSSLSQEHGIIKVTDDVMEKVTIGDIIHILPVHICLTVNLLRRFVTIEGEVINH